MEIRANLNNGEAGARAARQESQGGASTSIMPVHAPHKPMNKPTCIQSYSKCHTNKSEEHSLKGG